MSERFATGLVVGKFCPLHRGHQLLIDTALQRCEQVIVISYTNPEFEHCGPENRERWISDLFPDVTLLVIDDARLERLCNARDLAIRAVPHNDAPDYHHREFVAWLCCSVVGMPVNAVFTSEEYGDGFAEVLSDYFRAETNSSGRVRHVCVDQPRQAISISGTDIRHDPWGRRQFLAPVVYADLVSRVALLGGESSGKTTLAGALAKRFETAWVPEYGRELWEQRNGNLRPDDMPRIGLEQVARERRLGQQARRWLFCDTTPLTTAFYSQEMFGHVDPALELLASRTYDHIIVCAPEIAFVQDGTRQDERFRDRQHKWYLHELEKRELAYTVVSGTLEERIASVAARIEQRD